MYVSCPFKVKNYPENSESEDTFYRLDFFRLGQLVSVVWYLKLQYKHTCIKVFIAVKFGSQRSYSFTI